MSAPNDPPDEEEIFRHAAMLPVGQRAAYLESACAGRPDLLEAVARLLASIDDEEFMGKPLEATASPEMEAELARLRPEEPGESIGPYKLLQQIGEGGFGVVWMAEQQKPVRRRVALKIIKLGMDTKEVIARFEQERQALALMEHPNIAKVLDAGSTQWGRPFFVMELVRGVKITEYCDQASLPTEDRLQLFVAVCHAVQHAHQKGIIHRDLKPSNILVTLHDGVPVPKVIDFGVAKATQQQRLTELTLFTQFEQMIGTPLYMSPEQAELSGLDIDTRSDIYSLGVLLYELLTGRTPFDPETLRRAGLDEIRRVIREEEPQKPSIFVSTLGVDRQTDLAKHRQVNSAKLIGQIRGDLDWIVMKALEKDRTRRYETANGFAQDILRHLGSEPVQARPPTQFYRFRRFAKRNKVVFAATVIVSLALIGGLALSTFSFVREQAQRREADLQRENAKVKALEAEQNEKYSLRLLYASDMSLAQQAIDQSNLGRARLLLDRHRPQPGKEDLRGWEWRLLWQQCSGDAFALLTKRTERAVSVSFSADGRRLAVGYFKGRVELWDVPSRTLTKVLQEAVEVENEAGPHAVVAFSPAADTLAMAGVAGQVKSYDVAQDRMTVLSTAPGLIRDLCFSSDGAQLGALSRSKEEVQIIDVKTARVVTTIDLPPGGGHHFNNLRISPDHARVYVTFASFNEPKLRCIRVLDGQILWERSAWDAVEHTASGFSAMDVSPDGKVLVTARGYQTNDIQIWNAESGDLIGRLSGHKAFVYHLTFSRDGATLASTSYDQTVRLWNTATWQEAGGPLRGHGEEVECVDISPDGQMLASSARDGAVLLWNSGSWHSAGGRQMLPENVTFAKALPGGKMLLVRDAQGVFSLLNLATLHQNTLPLSREASALFSPPNFLGIQARADLFQFFEVTDAGATLVAEMPIHPSSTNSIAYCARKRLLAWTENAKMIHLTSVDRPTEQTELKTEGEFIEPVRFAPDGSYLLAADKEGIALFWDVAARRRLPSAEAYFSADQALLRWGNEKRRIGWGSNSLDNWISNAVKPEVAERRGTGGASLPKGYWPAGIPTDRAFAPDGRTYALSDTHGKVNLYDSSSGKKLATLHGRSTSVFCLTFSPDGTRLAVGNDVLWDVASRQELLVLPAVGPELRLAEFTDDGSTLLIGRMGTSGTFQFWRAPSWKEIQEAERMGKGWPENQQ